jgi:hypothetical protein
MFPRIIDRNKEGWAVSYLSRAFLGLTGLGLGQVVGSWVEVCADRCVYSCSILELETEAGW